MNDLNQKVSMARDKYLARIELMELMKETKSEKEFSIFDQFLKDCELYKVSNVLNTIKNRFVDSKNNEF